MLLHILWILLVCSIQTAFADLRVPNFTPCTPESELLRFSSSSEPPKLFCEKWNPDYLFNGEQCCGKYVRSKKKRRGSRCSPKRAKKSYCDEMTAEQLDYTQKVTSGKTGNLLQFLTGEMGKSGDQAYCSVNNGFLANGRRIVPTPENRIHVLNPQRCIHFGTDAMAGMLEWMGRRIRQTYSTEKEAGTNLIVGDISAPRGGCFFGRSGRRAHASHTSGQDADIGFLNPGPIQKEISNHFSRTFDPHINWWFLKSIFKNPFACIKVIFLDRRHIRSLSKYAKNDEDWNTLRRFIRHMPGHRNHFHVRIGYGPGEPGCVPGANPELEEDGDSFELEDAPIMDELEVSQASSKSRFLNLPQEP